MSGSRFRLAAVATTLTLLVASCSTGGGVLSIDDAWARSSAGMQSAGVVYMTIVGGDQSDRLVSVSVSSDVAAMAELHESVMAEDGTMTMRAVSDVDIGSGSTVLFEPGGLHVMLVQLVDPLEMGATFSLVLTFERAGDLTIEVEIRDD